MHAQNSAAVRTDSSFTLGKRTIAFVSLPSVQAYAKHVPGIAKLAFTVHSVAEMCDPWCMYK